MLTLHEKSRISSLLKRGRSLVAIAKITGHSRTTIRKVRVGFERAPNTDLTESEIEFELGIALEDKHKIVERYRCKVCGGMTTLQPCLVCELRGEL